MAAALSVDPLLLQVLQRDPGVTAVLKKLIHLRAAFEAPLLDVFGFPFILRHHLSAAACCACCISCCCCRPAAPLEPASQGPPCRAEDVLAESGAAVDAALSVNLPGGVSAVVTGARDRVGGYYDRRHPFASPAAPRSDAAATVTDTCLPCSPSRCFCCRGNVPHAGHAAVAARSLGQPQVAASRIGSSRDSSSTPSDSGRGIHEAEATRTVRRNRKRLRLVGDDTVAAVVAAAVCRHRSSRNARTQDERAVEILLSRNVLRQVKLPIDAGSYVLFFTADWLQCLQRSIRAAQQEILLLLKQQHDCARCGGADGELEYLWGSSGSSSSINNSGSKASSNSGSSCKGSSNSRRTQVTDTTAFCEHSTAAADGFDTSTSGLAVLENAGSSGAAAGCRLGSGRCGTECSTCCLSRSAAATQESTTAPLRFTPVLAQDEVQTDTQCEQCSDANAASLSRKRVLLHLPVMLGQQLKDVLLMQLLNVHTQTHIDKRVLEEVLGNYLRAWHHRRHDALLYLKEVLRSAEDLLKELDKEEVPCCGKERHQSEINNADAISRQVRSTHADVGGVAGTYNEDQPNNGRIKKEEGSHMHVRHTQAENSSRVREERITKQDCSCYNLEHKQSSVCVDATAGTPCRECSDACVSLSHTTGKARTAPAPTCNHIPMEEQTKTKLNAKGLRRTEEQSSTFGAKMSTALVKRLANLRELLQCGCKAAAEVFTLQENVAARATLNTEEVTHGWWSTTEAETDKGENWGGEEAWTEGCGRQTETQKSEEQGIKIMRIKEEKEEDAGGMEKNKELKRGPTVSTKTVEQDSEALADRFGSGTRRRHLSKAHAAVGCLEEMVHCATAIVQLLTEGEKTLSPQLTSHVVTPGTVHVGSLSTHARSPGTSCVSACATTSTAPAILRATDIRRTRAIDGISGDRDGRETANTLQQQSAARSAAITWQGQAGHARTAEEAKKHNREEAKKQKHQNTSQSSLQRAIDGILLLLFDAPLLYSRAGSNAVSLAVPQQGLLVRWIRDGRKEVLSSIRKRRFKEILWVDIERRGLLKSGLGSRMALLDLKGIGEVESTETAAGVVVRLVEEASRQA